MTEQNRTEIVTSKDSQVSTGNKSIEIRHEGKPVVGSSPGRELSVATSVMGRILLLIDTSASMDGAKIAKAKNGALSFSRDALQKGYLVGLVKFDSHAKMVVKPSDDLGSLEIGLATVKANSNGGTNMEEAIIVSARCMVGLPGQNIIVLVTDGVPTNRGDPKVTLKAAELAKSRNIDIMAIGTDDADLVFLGQLASRSELGMKVDSEKFEETIASSFKRLQSGSNIVKR
jgi:Mg-chelatase subunit ChlD